MSLQKGIHAMKYKLKDFPIKENNKDWWTEKSIKGKENSKVIAVNIFQRKKISLPNNIKKILEEQAEFMKQRYLREQEDVYLSAVLRKLFYVEDDRKVADYEVITSLWWKNKDNYRHHSKSKTITIHDGKTYMSCRNYFKSAMEKEMFI